MSLLPFLWGRCTRYRLLFLLLAGSFLFINSTYAQTVTVTGRVTESTGNPLPGVSIVVKGTYSTGTTTGEDGRYTLARVPSDAVLSFSFVGFKTEEIPVNGRTRIDVQLQEDVTALSEVVVNAGYYTVKDQLRTGSIARVTAKEIENQPVNNAISAIQGRVAGVSITQGTGVAGGGYNIQIRGTNSLRRAGNYPMYIIDGVPVSTDTPSSFSGAILPYTEINPLNAINPNDIESIEILKDADATAIYGSRGANGVILVTTRKGKPGSKTGFSVNTGYGFSRVAGKMEMMNTEQYLDMRRQAYTNDGIANYPANAYDVNGTWDQERYTDWQEKLIGGTAVNSAVQLSVSGGNGHTSFLISGSHNGQTTVFAKDFRYKTNNLSGSLNHRSSDNRFTFSASGLFSDQSNNLIESDITSESLRLSPNAPALYMDDGSLNWENNTFTNPLAAYESTYSNQSRTLNVNINLGYELLPSLHIKFNGGINHQVFEELSLYPNTVYNPSYGITPANSMAYKNHNQRFSYLLEPQLNYKHRFKDHEIDILLGSTYQETENTALNVMGYGFESNALITNLAAAGNVSVNSDTGSEYKYAAVFGRVNYQYKNKYILNLTGRRDGSSRFGPDNRFANFGAIGVAWLFSEENFLADNPWFSFGKLRASHGVTGSDLIGDYQYLDTYTVSSIIYGDGTTLYPSRLHNPYFSWEKTTKLEIALELGLLDDRLYLTTAWFRNRSGNQLVGIPLPGTTGFSSIQANLPATVENKGLELELNTIPVKTGQFRWNSNVNISFPKNKLVAFPGLEGSTYANQYVVGYPVSITKVYNYEGIDPETGLYTFTDYNEDGRISSPEDNRVIEEVGVKWFGGWFNQLSYKQWECSFLFQFVNQRQKNYNALMANPGTRFNQPAEVLDVWSESNPDGRYMPYSTGANPLKNQLLGYFRNSTAVIGDASFIRLKNVQLSYRLSVNKYIQDVRFYAQGQNLLTLTDYFGLDPEFTLTGYLPPLKTWAFGVQINF
ncbi:SusC/RagA family TonB-linked outer membrane protein [uncultured Proteiniphilum sp.]|uniref:SusC/RagA family TonB-linked outer membrane protein n=1 Tax=uncultured Proteiniphilum sp. TaxID=497637 RepID=UPI00261B5CF9|nr:SusC/RagA family TonB-linked outer membrane protein [uncultured Proteiniphilum sp.]